MSKRKNTRSDRRLFAMRYFMDKGLSPHAAAGLVGNLYRESRLNPDSLNSSSNALGIAQWLGDRRTNLISTYGNAPTLLQQLDFIWHELNTTHKKGLLTLLNSKDATEAARNAMGYYEFSAGPEGAIRAMNKSGQNGQRSMDEGIAFANEIYNMYAPPVVTVADEPVLQSLPTPTVRPPRRTVKQVNKVLPEITVYGNRPVNTPQIAPTRQPSRKSFNDHFNYEMLRQAGMVDDDADLTNMFLLNGLNRPKYEGGKDPTPIRRPRHDANHAIYDAETDTWRPKYALPGVVIRPDLELRNRLHLVFPNPTLRKSVLSSIAFYKDKAEIRPDYDDEDPYRKEKPRANKQYNRPRVDSKGIVTTHNILLPANYEVERMLDLYKKSGSPKVYFEPIPSLRSYYRPDTHAISIDSYLPFGYNGSDFLEELGHAYQFYNNLNRYGRNIRDDYDDPNSIEYQNHSIIVPAIYEYLRNTLPGLTQNSQMMESLQHPSLHEYGTK